MRERHTYRGEKRRLAKAMDLDWRQASHVRMSNGQVVVQLQQAGTPMGLMTAIARRVAGR